MPGKQLRADKLIILGLVVTVLLFTLSGLMAQDYAEPPVPVETVFSASGVQPGGNIKLAAIFKVPDKHHITDVDYGLWYLDVQWPDGVTCVDTVFPEGTMSKGERIYRGEPAILYSLAVGDQVQPGDYDIKYGYSYQICRELEPESCFLPNGGEGTITLHVLSLEKTPIPSGNPVFGAGTGNDEVSVTAEESSLENRLTRALEGKSLGAFFLVFLAGILVSFTPCVYPMIPIIIGFVGAGAGGSRSKGFIMSLFFVLGLTIMYAILGVIAGATGALFGAFMQNAIVLWVIVAIFTAMGFSMLGFFDIALPASVQGKLMAGQKQGLIGAVLMGGVTGIVAAPCAGPPLLVLLGWIGNTGNLVLGFFLMAVFALGIGVLFIVIGTFAGAMTALPQAGSWMDSIKKFLGVLIFAVAIYYLGMLIPANIHTLIIGGFLLFIGVFLGAFAAWDNLGKGGKYGKAFGLLLVLAGAFYFLLGLTRIEGVSLSGGTTVVQSGSSSAEEMHVPWNVNMYDEILSKAEETGKPVLIDFYADWCGVCVELDHKVWNQPDVIEAADAYLPLKLDFTRSNPELEILRKKYSIGGLPTILILGPDSKERSRFSSFKSPAEVVSWLERNR